MRATIKVTTAAVFSALQDDEKYGAMFMLLSGAAQIFAEVSETADLRMARYFPAKAWVCAFDVEAGTQNLRVEFLDARGGIIEEKQFPTVVTGAKKLTLLEAYCLK